MSKTILLTACALVAFAANSLLCRLALRPNSIDAASFTLVRFGVGTAVLLLLARARSAASSSASRSSGFAGAIALAIYALPFSLAYVRLAASTGALILFGTVQLTMFGWSLVQKQRPKLREWLGLGLALGGLIALNAPSATSPDPLGAALMAIAGIGWAAYTIHGRGVTDPIAAIARSFVYALPAVLVTALLAFVLVALPHANARGLLLAAASGAFASAIGYVVWYTALSDLSAAQAGVAQLAVPIIAALGGVVLLDEVVSPRLAVTGALIVAGIALALSAKRARIR